MAEYLMAGVQEPSDAFHQKLKDKVIELERRIELLEERHLWRTCSDD